MFSDNIKPYIVAFTSLDQKNVVEAFEKHGFDSYITKPAKIVLLKNFIKDFTENVMNKSITSKSTLDSFKCYSPVKKFSLTFKTTSKSHIEEETHSDIDF